MTAFKLKIAGLTLICLTRFEETVRFFSKYREDIVNMPVAPCGEGPEEEIKYVRIADREWKNCESNGILPSAPAEASLLTATVSDALLRYDRIVIHAAAVRWHDAAYLICAHSGTGKTTQVGVLQELRPGEFSVICGDRPVLEFRANELLSSSKIGHSHNKNEKKNGAQIIVHPSPWNGKEDWHGAEAAPLAGIILLKRGEENSISAVSKNDAAIPLYVQFIHTGWEAENIRKIAALETRLLCSVPIWELTTNSVPDSTKLLLKEVFS